MGNLCALHAINAVLKRRNFESENLVAIAEQLDEDERFLFDSNDFSNPFRSENMDKSGNFSIQSISAALALSHLELISYHSSYPRAVTARKKILAVNGRSFVIAVIIGSLYSTLN